jgi:hypothetical protein
VLDTVEDPNIRAFTVWVPILATDQHAPDDDTFSLVTDRRAAHYWDENGILPHLFRETLRLRSECAAWDVYLIYPPGVKWETEPPEPVCWQHQLDGITSAPCLDGKTFAKAMSKVLRFQP